MAQSGEFFGGNTSTPMVTRAELQDVTRKLDSLFELMANSPMFRTPPPQQNSVPLIPNPNPDNTLAEQERRNREIPVLNVTAAPLLSHSTRVSHQDPNNRLAESRMTISRGASLDTADSGAPRAARKRKAEEGSPLSREILDTMVPEFRSLNLESYQGKSDPLVFLNIFEGQMLAHTLSDGAKCKILVSTLRESAMMWFHRLPHGSITSLARFKRMLTSVFACSQLPRKNNRTLLSLEQGSTETLRDISMTVQIL